MKRMVPLIRSDRLFVPDEQQAQFVGFSQWIPFHGTGLLFGDSNIMIEGVTWKKEEMRYDLDLYMIRSMYSTHMTCCLDVRKTDFPWDDLRAILDEWRAIVPYYPVSYTHLNQIAPARRGRVKVTPFSEGFSATKLSPVSSFVNVYLPASCLGYTVIDSSGAWLLRST